MISMSCSDNAHLVLGLTMENMEVIKSAMCRMSG